MSELDAVFREEYGAIMASLTRSWGSIELAEDLAQEAFVVASERWERDGVPPNPGGWLLTTARRRGIDRLRREQAQDRAYAAAGTLWDRVGDEPEAVTGPVTDDRLRMLFTCAHPALAEESRVALTLRILGGLSVEQIAAASLVEPRALAQRITRAKRKIANARIPYRVPSAEDLPGRLSGVLATLYLTFNEGYFATDAADRPDLAGEAIRLARQLRAMLPGEPEVAGLLALMLLTDARRDARFAGDVLVPLGEQDRARWDRTLIAEGHRLVRQCLALGRPGRYQLMAAIAAVHTDAARPQDTAWDQVVALYDQLIALEPTPVVALNRAVAVGELDGPQRALALVEELGLERHHAWHAVRAELLRRLGRGGSARSAYDAAISAATNPAEITHLRARRATL